MSKKVQKKKWKDNKNKKQKDKEKEKQKQNQKDQTEKEKSSDETGACDAASAASGTDGDGDKTDGGGSIQGTKDELLGTKDDEEHLTFPNRSGFDIRKIELKLNFYDCQVQWLLQEHWMMNLIIMEVRKNNHGKCKKGCQKQYDDPCYMLICAFFFCFSFAFFFLFCFLCFRFDLLSFFRFCFFLCVPLLREKYEETTKTKITKKIVLLEQRNIYRTFATCMKQHVHHGYEWIFWNACVKNVIS